MNRVSKWLYLPLTGVIIVVLGFAIMRSKAKGSKLRREKYAFGQRPLNQG